MSLCQVPDGTLSAAGNLPKNIKILELLKQNKYIHLPLENHVHKYMPQKLIDKVKNIPLWWSHCALFACEVHVSHDA